MTCPNCGAPMHQALDAMKCDYCQTIYFPEKDDSGVRVLGETLSQTCPICSTPLSAAAFATIPIGYCTTCRGMSISMPVLSTLVDELRSDHTGADFRLPPTPPNFVASSPVPTAINRWLPISTPVPATSSSTPAKPAISRGSTTANWPASPTPPATPST